MRDARHAEVPPLRAPACDTAPQRAASRCLSSHVRYGHTPSGRRTHLRCAGGAARGALRLRLVKLVARRAARVRRRRHRTQHHDTRERGGGGGLLARRALCAAAAAHRADFCRVAGVGAGVGVRGEVSRPSQRCEGSKWTPGDKHGGTRAANGCRPSVERTRVASRTESGKDAAGGGGREGDERVWARRGGDRDLHGSCCTHMMAPESTPSFSAVSLPSTRTASFMVGASAAVAAMSPLTRVSRFGSILGLAKSMYEWWGLPGGGAEEGRRGRGAAEEKRSGDAPTRAPEMRTAAHHRDSLARQLDSGAAERSVSIGQVLFRLGGNASLRSLRLSSHACSRMLSHARACSAAHAPAGDAGSRRSRPPHCAATFAAPPLHCATATAPRPRASSRRS